MLRRLVLCAIVVSGLLVVGREAFADDTIITCPATAHKNTNVPVTVKFKNHDTAKALQITRAALALHLGNVTLIGPIVFQMFSQQFPSGITVSPATFVPPPAGCVGCAGSVIPTTATVMLTPPNGIPIPAQARLGTFITVGLQFFGTFGTSTIRESIGGDACQIEIVP